MSIQGHAVILLLRVALLLVRPDVAQHCIGDDYQRCLGHSRGKLLTSSLSSQSVERIVALALGPDLSAEGKGGGGGEGTAVGVDVGDDDLDGGVVLGGDEGV